MSQGKHYNMINSNDMNNNNNNNKKIEWRLIEEKWRRKWDEQKIFNIDPDFSKKKYFITVAYPYPNSPQHIGHGRTYTLADVHARYMRMKGYNVLFPMGFHYTGTPILAMSRRIAAGDKELLETFQNTYHVAKDTIKSFVEPIKIASYFHNEIKLGMKEMGYSIDWRREFTTIDKLYSKFISWQFNTLRNKGLIVQGSHPVGWCPKDQNPVSQHDTIGDVEPDFNEYTLIKFKLDDGYIIPTATLRPETIYGVTNLWVNPKVEYVRIHIDNERWIVSKEAARKLEFLNHNVAIESSIYGREIVGKYVEDPVRKVSIPLYPASFVESNNGTGIVMSVPAHAPYDFQAIEDLKQNISLRNEFVELKVDVIPITIIGSEDYTPDVNNDHPISPAAKMIMKYKIKDQDDPQLEKATNELYSQEYYKGKMLQNTQKYVGMPVSLAKDRIKKEIILSGAADVMFELINKPVRCRCGTECVVKLLNDQWFLNYGDKKWKNLAHECLDKMDIIPEEIRQEFNYVIDWLRERACARKSGLGTKLPMDHDWIIESLSDSVIYMSYYILAKYVNNNSIFDGDNKLMTNTGNDVDVVAIVDNLNDSFFDYIFLGNGNASHIAVECKISLSLLEEIRNEFSYFYPLDARHSGRDLVQNHLAFFIFNHVAIFRREHWPKKIVVNGSVLMEGKKMSKSLANIIPLRTAIKDYSADAVRLAMLGSAELLQDADFSFDAIKGIRSTLDDIYNMAMNYSTAKLKPGSSLVSSMTASEMKREIEDRWLVSRLQNYITDITVSMDKSRVRKALHDILYMFDQDLQWYKKRINAKNREDSAIVLTLSIFLKSRIRMLAPFAPFISEEIWQIIGDESHSIIFAGWPNVNEDKRDLVAEESEQLIINIISDLQNILKVTKISPVKIIIYTSAGWKQKIYQKILSFILLKNKTNFGDIMKQLIKDPETAKAKNDPKLIRNIVEDILSDPIEARNRRLKLTVFDEIFPLKDAKMLLSIESGNAQAEIILHSEDDTQKYDPKEKSKYSRPFKPAIYIE
ncbi:MAG TPA: leucine--tRNA ligase [Nitrososphaeraceae archaeon]|nr:leucine--tRNA ligase [Nitrososphaeraceae archaeon]